MTAVLLLLASLGAEPVDFDTEVLPVLSKAGCNAAACHGSAAGRGDFRLSLFGGDPAADYDAIVHELEGRRVNLAHPRASLIVAKPTLQLEHGGELRFDSDSPPAELFVRWIAQGAPRLRLRTLASLTVEPAEFRAAGLPASVKLRVTATFDDGSRRDVTREALYSTSDDASLSADENGRLTLHRRGRHTAVIRFLDGMAAVAATAPLSDAPIEQRHVMRRNWIDDEISETLASLGLPASPPAEDAEFLRRIRLDLTGRLPQPEEVRQFVASDDADKRDKLVDELLASQEFIDYWTFKLASLLRVRSVANDPPAAAAFHQWIRSCVAGETPYDAMAREVLVAEGDTHSAGAAAFHRVASGPREQAEFVSELFLGVRLRCANCHNHPLDRWTQDDYHGLAAIFARLERGRVVRELERGEVTHPGTGDAAIPRLPGDCDLAGDVDGRATLAEWLTDDDNPYFARAIVNRLWKAMMGRGLVEPTDDLRSTNPATHPRLLERLADDFVAHGYDFRHTLRTIAASAAYRRSGDALRENASDDRFYSHALSRPLEAEVLADAIADVTGVAETYGKFPIGTRATALTNPLAPSESLDVLGRCPANESCEGAATTAGGLTTKLHLLNGPLVNAKVASPNGRLHRLIAAGVTNEKIVEEFYLRALGRFPRREEAEFWLAELAASAEDERMAGLEDFLWSLLNSREFLTNH
ncbi:MAG: DUF1549 and DUF1553 domain-containing protein [Planctomycetes bacterium]|nr:DUF1549 and DUF1553 domain-containing protein [Planctomycetota bacterium]